MRQALLELAGVSCGYGQVQVLHDVSLKVLEGEIVTVIGANGAGKTTTLLAISQFLPLASGNITFDAKNLALFPPHHQVKLGLAHVPEGRKIFSRLTVAENLELGAYSRSDRSEINIEQERVFTLFPLLKERLQQVAGTLSGGEQQMLAIGRALMSKPRMLLLDEPSMGVAPKLVERIFQTIVELNKSGLTVLLIEQNAHLALQIANRGYVIELGRITLSDSPKALLANPKVQEAYLGA